MLFALSLLPCPACAARDWTWLFDRSGAGGTRIYSGACRPCRARSEARFHVPPVLEGSPAPPRFHLGGAQPSALIGPGEFLAEVARLAPGVDADPRRLAPEIWDAQWQGLVRLITCLTELIKSGGTAECGIETLVSTHMRLCAVLAEYEADAPRVLALKTAANPPRLVRGEISSRSLEAHLQWVRRGRTGEGRLDVANVKLAGVKIGAKDLSGARIQGAVLERCDASFSTLAGAELEKVSFVQAHLGNCRFDEARVQDCDFLGANLALAKFSGATFCGGRFERAFLDRSTFRGARLNGVNFREAEFGNALLDDAVFMRCDLRGAKLSLNTARVLGTNVRTRFEGCNLRATTWQGRDLASVLFVDCERDA